VPLDVVPGVRVEVCTGDGRPVPVGVTGELVVDGWCTGELGWLAETGALHVEGREALRRHGLALNAAVVERRLTGHPAVADATVAVAAGQPYADVVLRHATPQAEDHADAAPPVAEAVREVGAGVDGRGLRRYLRRRVGVGEVPVTRIRVVGVQGGAVGRTGEERG
jgi:acyl-coenzyme A synthetase/AMP-(fatty) acid ligase